MNNIDFLPVQYRQKHVYRHAKPWQIIVVTSFLGLVVVATISQKVHRRIVEKELAELGPAYEMAMNEKQQLADFQAQLKQMEVEGELIAYLHHPWPRSQLISALLSRLPEEITLHQLQITREAEHIATQTERHPGAFMEISPERIKSMPPAERDLHALQSQYDNKQTVVILAGTTTDGAALHRYLDEILLNSLFSKTELGAVTNISDHAGIVIQFNAKIFVKPGYGQMNVSAEALKTSNPPNPHNTSHIKPWVVNDLAFRMEIERQGD